MLHGITDIIKLKHTYHRQIGFNIFSFAVSLIVPDLIDPCIGLGEIFFSLKDHILKIWLNAPVGIPYHLRSKM